MSKFKRCENPGCSGTISRQNPHVIKLVSIDEGFDIAIHGYEHRMSAGKCKCCGSYDTGYKIKNIKMALCNICYREFKECLDEGLVIEGLPRRIESFDERKNVAYYTLREKNENEIYTTWSDPRVFSVSDNGSERE